MNINESLLIGLNEHRDLLYEYGCVRSQVKAFMDTPLPFSDRQMRASKIIEGILEAHEKESLLGHLCQLARIELHIGGLQPEARDHVVHALFTFILGAYINELFLEASHRVDIFQWKLSALMHDIAYPIEIAQRTVIRPFENAINDIRSELGTCGSPVRILIAPENLELLSNNENGLHLIQKRIDDWGLAVNAEHAYREMLSSNSMCHGMISGLILLHILDLMYQKNNPSRSHTDTYHNNSNVNWSQRHFEEDIVSACAAVFVHNLKAIYFNEAKIIRDKAPLAFLLRLSDAMQDWERPTLNNPTGTPADKYDIYIENRQLIFKCDTHYDRRNIIEKEIYGALAAKDILIR